MFLIPSLLTIVIKKKGFKVIDANEGQSSFPRGDSNKAEEYIGVLF